MNLLADSIPPHRLYRTMRPGALGAALLARRQINHPSLGQRFQPLPVIEDGHPHPEHCSIDFSAFEKKAIEKKAKLLRAAAATRG